MIGRWALYRSAHAGANKRALADTSAPQLLKGKLPSIPTKRRPRLQSLAEWVSISLEKVIVLNVATGGARMAHRLRFGVFLAPFHKPGINPTLALQSDLELI